MDCFLLFSFLESAISTPKIITFLPVPPVSGCLKVFGEKAIPYPE